jgi:glycosyltransferase involved in cell wall biosynthesis
MDGLRISVAMCTYNGVRFLREQLESIAAQTRLPDELVICDDRSTDESVEIIKPFLHHSPFAVRLEINDSNRGSTKNFEKAIGLCQGEIIALADQDDVWHPDKLESIEKAFHGEPNLAAIFSDAELINEDSELLDGTLWESFSFTGRERRRFKNGHALEVLLKHLTVTGATLAFSEKYRNLVLPIPHNHIHDSWISFLLASVAEIRPIERPTVRYRQHRRQQCGLTQKETFAEQVVSSTQTDPRSYLPEINQLEQICERLIERTAMFPCHKNAIRLIREKIRHRQIRAAPPKSKIFRLLIVVRELITLRYLRYSKGFRSAAKDLFVWVFSQK